MRIRHQAPDSNPTITITEGCRFRTGASRRGYYRGETWSFAWRNGHRVMIGPVAIVVT